MVAPDSELSLLAKKYRDLILDNIETQIPPSEMLDLGLLAEQIFVLGMVALFGSWGHQSERSIFIVCVAEHTLFTKHLL